MALEVCSLENEGSVALSHRVEVTARAGDRTDLNLSVTSALIGPRDDAGHSVSFASSVCRVSLAATGSQSRATLCRCRESLEEPHHRHETLVSPHTAQLLRTFPKLQGFNYYPGDTPWHEFWPSYSREVIRRDFGRIAECGANVVRTFLPYEPELSRAQIDTRLQQLRDLLDVAHSLGLGVIVTLFDFSHPYPRSQWASADEHLSLVLSPLADHEAIVAWDLKNEPDLDEDRHGQRTVQLFVEFAAKRARAYAPRHRLTVGFATARAACSAASFLDFVSYHDYGSPSDLANNARAVAAVCPQIPSVLSEFGKSSGILGPALQADYFRSVFEELERAPLSGYLIWAWSDFNAVPHGVSRADPTMNLREANFGLVDRLGQAKPALSVVRAQFIEAARHP